MPDLDDLSKIVGIIGVIVTSLGVVFVAVLGLSRKVRDWITRRVAFSAQGVPRRTITTVLQNEELCWWNEATMQDQPAMQVHGDVMVANISDKWISLPVAQIGKSRTLGTATIKNHTSTLQPSERAPCGFMFFVQPPVKMKGKTFIADVALVDQFGNSHWMRKMKFVFRE